MKKNIAFSMVTLTFFLMSVAQTFAVGHATFEKQTNVQNTESTTFKIDTPNNFPFKPGTEIKATSSCSHLTSVSHLVRNQEIFCLFDILFEVKGVEDYQPRIPVTLSSFFLNLFSSIISPNAP